MIPEALLRADRDRQFADWGMPVTYRRVTAVFDPQTQQVAETVVDTPLSAVVGSAPSQAQPGIAARHLTEERRLLIKTEDLPTPRPAATDRVIYDGTEYDLQDFTLDNAGLMWTLRCRRRG